MCSPHKPDVKAQQAEAARQASAEEARYNAQLAAQQAEWERQRVDATNRFNQQLAQQQAEIDRQAKLTSDQQAATEAANKKKADDAAAVTARGRSYADYRDSAIQQGAGAVNDAFSSFNPDYFSKYADQFVAANRLDEDNRYERGTRSMKYKLADNRNLNSSAAADAFGEMDVDHNSAISKIAAAGSDKARDYANTIAAQKSAALNSLYALGNGATPDFQTDEDALAAQGKLGSALLTMGQNIRGSAQTMAA